MAEEEIVPFPLPLTVFFCVKYSVEYALKLREVQRGPPPGRGRGVEGRGKSGALNDRQS